MDALDREAVPLCDFVRFVLELVPDAEAAARPSDVRFVRSAAADTRVEAKADPAGFCRCQFLDLLQRTRVYLHALSNQPPQLVVAGQTLRREGNMRGVDPCLDRSLYLISRRGVDMDAEAVKRLQDAAVARGLHRVSNREPETVGEAQAILRILD